MFDRKSCDESKPGKKQMIAYLKHLPFLYYHRYKKFGKFCFVGASGTAIHFAILYGLTEWLGLFYLISATIAVLAASTNNYLLNHIWTFKDSDSARSFGVKDHAIGWLKYNSTSLIIDAMYIGLLALFVELFGLWYILGAFLALCATTPMRFMIVSKWIWGKKSNPAAYDWEAFKSFNLLRRYWKRKMAEKVWSMAGNPPKDILDCGCGSSPIITHFPTAIGIDIDPDKLDFMKTKVGNKLLYMDVSNLEFPDESFDLVLFIEAIEHLETRNTALSEISRVLRPGGTVIIATPDDSKILWKIIQFLYDKLMTGGYEEEHINLLTKDSLIQLARSNGLRLVKLDYVAYCDMIAKFEKEGK